MSLVWPAVVQLLVFIYSAYSRINHEYSSLFIIVINFTLCCFVDYSTRLFILCLTLCCFALVFFSPFSIAITSLGEERANLGAFRSCVRFTLVWFFISSGIQ